MLRSRRVTNATAAGKRADQALRGISDRARRTIISCLGVMRSMRGFAVARLGRVEKLPKRNGGLGGAGPRRWLYTTGVGLWALAMLPSYALCQIKVQESTTVYCDGSFTTVLNYQGSSSTTPAQHQGAFGDITDFSQIKADKLDPIIPGVVTITGTLKNACDAGLTDFTLSGGITTNITVRASPIHLTLPPNPVRVNERRAFRYRAELTPCLASAGATLELSLSTSTTIAGASAPDTADLPAAGAGAMHISVTGRLKPNDDSGYVRIGVVKPAADRCMFPDTEISE